MSTPQSATTTTTTATTTKIDAAKFVPESVLRMFRSHANMLCRARNTDNAVATTMCLAEVEQFLCDYYKLKIQD